jgi:hypothetical protein
LPIALPTVKFHITNILSKLTADNRTEAVLLALKHRLVPPASRSSTGLGSGLAMSRSLRQ